MRYALQCIVVRCNAWCYPLFMSGAKDDQIVVRVEKKKRKELEAEAEADGRDLSGYVRHLIDTHPKRKKSKAS